MAEIRFDNVSKRFGESAVVRGLDLTIKDGEFFTFVGPSGCGKSTILGLIAGLEQVTAGGIFFDGAEVTRLSPVERDVAMVFQSYALYPHLSVYDNIAFPLRMKKTERKEIDREVRRVAALLGIGELLERRPRQLSGGQRQRVALGRAIVRRPRVFLMDEPLSNLDARLRVETRGELKRLHRELGITTVYVTHDQAEALGLSERIAVLHGGTIEQCGTPHEVYFRPANLFVAGFIGSPPMNVVEGKVVQAEPLAVDCLGRRFSPFAAHPPAAAEVLVGIRPDDMAVADQASPESWEVTVSVIEPAGPFNWVEFVRGGVWLRGAAAPEARLAAGEKAFASFPAERVHLFDAASGRRLEGRERPGQ